MVRSTLAAAALAVVFGAAPAQAVLVERLVMKVSDLAPSNDSPDGFIDPHLDWVNPGGHNVGAPGATSLLNNGVDFKDPFVDTNWADVVQVRVGMYSGGALQKYILFDAAGTTKDDFYARANAIGGSYGLTGLPAGTGSGNYFSIPGHDIIDRHWFVNNNYGGCSIDAGHFVVLDDTEPTNTNPPCTWESTRYGVIGSNERAFLYSNNADRQNWNESSIGIADVFAVSVFLERQDPSTGGEIPLPAAGWLGLAGMGALGWLRARRRRGA